MKLVAGTLIILTWGLCASAAPTLGGEQSLTGVTVKTCGPDDKLCLQVKSDKTVGSQFQALHRLKNPVVTIEDRVKKTKRVVKPMSAYIDLDNNQLVWTEQGPKDSVIETSYHLDTLQKSEMVLK